MTPVAVLGLALSVAATVPVPIVAAQPAGIEIRAYGLLSKARIYKEGERPPAPGVQVTVIAEGGGEVTAVTGADGIARIELSPGLYRVRWSGTERFEVRSGCEEVTASVEAGMRTIVHLRAFDLVDSRPGSPPGSYSFVCPSTIRLFTPFD